MSGSAWLGVRIGVGDAMEGFDGPTGAWTDTLRQLQQTLEAAGVEFLPEGGVRLRELPGEAS